MDDEFDKLLNDEGSTKFKAVQEKAANGSKQHEAGTSKEKPFIPKKWVNKESSSDMFDIETIFQGEQLSSDLQKCRLYPPPETPFCSLQRIYQTPNCPLPIPTNERFKHLSVDIRSRLLSDYFTNIVKLQMQHYRKSLIRAPQPKEFALKAINSSTLSSSSKQKSDEKDVYFTRSGRPLKRKNYTENENNETDEEAILKKNKIDADTVDKLTFDDFNFDDKPVKVESPQTKTPKSAKKPPTKRLFNKLSSRSAKILDNSKVETEKKTALENDILEFERSLCTDSLCMDTEESSQKDEDFKSIRISPPLPQRYRRPLRPTKSQIKSNIYKELPIRVSQKSPTRSQTNATSKTRAKSVSDISNSDNTKTDSTMEQVPCPICNKLFDQDRIQDHAANCGLDELEEERAPPRSDFMEKLTCEICNREFLISKNYEIHVKNCIASKIIEF